MPNKNSYSLTRTFGDLKVRPKLIVLHNLFFLVLSGAAYFSLIPLFEQQIADARAREALILEQLESPAPGEPTQILPPNGSPGQPGVPASSSPSAAEEANQSYQDALFSARLTLFLVLGSIYIAAVLLLEAVIMPLYVYQPIRRTLDADMATRAGDRQREIIPAHEILGDEIGQIMRSRNETVSQLRKQEDELAAALKKLEEQDRLVSLGLLSASVAHELNTPLAVLHGSVEQLLETEEDPHARQRLARIQRVAQRLKTISESLVDFARVRKHAVEPVPAWSLIDEAWGLVSIDPNVASVRFTNRVQPSHQVLGSPDRLAQVFVNLLRNAINAFEASPDTQDREVWVSSRELARMGKPGICISIEDNGPGIPPDVLPEIFDAFVTTRLDSHGTGLGLTVAQGIVTQHGGSLTASNRQEGGARLEVWLPAAPSPGTKDAVDPQN